jgi:glycosyltransferase involved in cell wall biosynthesis
MKVLIDMQGAQTPFSKNRGVGRYTMSLVEALIQSPRGHEVILAMNGNFLDETVRIREKFSKYLPCENFAVWQQFYNSAQCNPNNAGMAKVSQLVREHFFASFTPDFIFSTNLQEGIFDNAPTSVKLVETGARYVTTLHDVVPLAYPKQYLSGNTKNWYYEKIDYAKRSDILLTDSEFSKQEISKRIKFPVQKIFVLPLAVSAEFLSAKETNADDSRISGKYPERYIMYTGGGDLHKNLGNLLKAYISLPDKIRAEYKLLLVGKGLEETLMTSNRREVSLLKIEGSLVFTGFVSDEDLAFLYRNASLFVFPSIYEGFGIPPLEAMACGAVVIGSNAASIPEVIGMQEALFNPFSTESIRNAILTGLTDSNFRNSFLTHARTAVSKFSWENSALKFWDILENSPRCEKKKVSVQTQRSDVLVKQLANMDEVKRLKKTDVAKIANSIAETFSFEKSRRSTLFLDVSAIVRQDDNSGIQRVVKAIARALLMMSLKIDVELVYTTTGDHEFYRAGKLREKLTGSKSSKEGNEWIEFKPNDILLFLDLHPSVAISHVKKTQYLRGKGIRVFHLVYDILPMQFPEFFWPELNKEFNEWLLAVAKSDGALCISNSVKNELAGWLEANGAARDGFEINYFHLGADIENASPSIGFPENHAEIVDQIANAPTFLMVGTIEPRKGHGFVLDAFDELWKAGHNVNLVIVGRKGWKTENLVGRFEEHPFYGKQLRCLHGISDEFLDEIYQKSTCLIAASLNEGFGLPLIEAARHGIPIIARDIPVFREVAQEHAFYFDGTSPEALAAAIEEWLSLKVENRVPESESMKWLTWAQSARQLLRALGISG